MTYQSQRSMREPLNADHKMAHTWRTGMACALGALLLLSPALLHARIRGDSDGTAQHAKALDSQAASNKPSPSLRRSALTADEGASPSEPLAVDIESAIFMALGNNHALNVERLKPAIQRTFEDQERAAFDPVIEVDASSSQERTGDNAGGGSVTRTDSTDAEVDISGFIPTGTEVGIALSTDRTWTDLYGDQHTTRAGLSVTQALLRGAGMKVNLASLRQARLDTFSSQYEFRGFVESLLADVEKTYWEYALARRRIEIFIESLSLAEQQMKETEERIRIGVLSEIERAAVRAEVALRKEDLINARSDFAKVRLRLLRLLNPPGPDLWGREILLQDQPAVPEITLDKVEAHVAVGLRMRSDLNQARMQLERGDLEVVKTKNGLLPRMDFFITMGKSGYADSFSGSLRDLDGDNYDVRAGISLEYPFFNRGAKARHERALLSRQNADEALGNLAQLVQMDIRSAYIEVNRSREQVFATAATRKLQEEKMRAETEKFRVGKSTSFLVAQTQRDLVASSISEIQAIVGYLKSLIELYRQEGSLLERRRISLPGAEYLQF